MEVFKLVIYLHGLSAIYLGHKTLTLNKQQQQQIKNQWPQVHKHKSRLGLKLVYVRLKHLIDVKTILFFQILITCNFYCSSKI